MAVKTAGELSSWIKCRLTCHCLLLPTLCPTGSHHKDTRDAQRKENAATIKTEKPQMAGEAAERKISEAFFLVARFLLF